MRVPRWVRGLLPRRAASRPPLSAEDTALFRELARLKRRSIELSGLDLRVRQIYGRPGTDENIYGAEAARLSQRIEEVESALKERGL